MNGRREFIRGGESVGASGGIQIKRRGKIEDVRSCSVFPKSEKNLSVRIWGSETDG